jgi:predicted nucleotidyltransferase
VVATAEEKMQLARRAADLLYAHGAQRVWVFGSVATGRRQDFRSDLDLAVEGLPAEIYFRMVGELLQLLPCSVDLVEMETAPPSLRDNIVRHRIFLPREN